MATVTYIATCKDCNHYFIDKVPLKECPSCGSTQLNLESDWDERYDHDDD